MMKNNYLSMNEEDAQHEHASTNESRGCWTAKALRLVKETHMPLAP